MFLAQSFRSRKVSDVKSSGKGLHPDWMSERAAALGTRMRYDSSMLVIEHRGGKQLTSDARLPSC